MSRFFASLAAIALTLFPLAAAAGMFDGVYDADPRLCAISSSSTTRLQVSGDRLNFYTAHCRMQGGVDGHMRLACADGDGAFVEHASLRRTPQGVMLRGFGGARELHRCR